jgi:two-component system, NarL family, invasion response regulator UvrY
MTEDALTRILIVDHHTVVREGLKQILSVAPEFLIVGEASTGLEAIRTSRQIALDVIILEISLPDKNGLDVLKQIKKENPDFAIVVLSGLKEDQYAVRALKAGASGFLSKHDSAQQIVDAIKLVASGLKYVSPELAQELANSLNHGFEGEAHRLLSDREFQTLTMIAMGKSVSDIARELSLSVKTISEYRARILLKMKLRHNAELTHYAIKNQLVE